MAAAKGQVAKNGQSRGKDAEAPSAEDGESCLQLAVPKDPPAAQAPADDTKRMLEDSSTPRAKLEKEAPKKRERLDAGVVFTLGAPSTWDISEFYSVITRHKIRAVLDMRPGQETVPTTESVRVACSAYGVDYERHRVLTDAYVKLVSKARGEAGDAVRPCILLGGAVCWRLLQTRRCISRYMDVKNLVVHHLSWSGDVDDETAVESKKDPKRTDFKYPKAPPANVKAKAKSRPTEGSSATSSTAAPVMPSRPKGAPSAASASATAPPVMPSRPKGGATIQTSEQRAKAEAQAASSQSQPKPAASQSQPDTVLKSKPKASAAGDDSSAGKLVGGLLLNQPKAKAPGEKAKAPGEPPAGVPAAKPMPSAKMAAGKPSAAPKKETTASPPLMKAAPKPKSTTGLPAAKPKPAGKSAPDPAAKPKPAGKSGAGGLIRSLLENDAKRRKT